MRRQFIHALAATAALIAASTAAAVVGGSPDATHTYAGAALQRQVHDGVVGTQLCSGALVSPTVFVTAGHCFAEGSTVSVTFAANFTTPGAAFFTGTAHDSIQADLAVIVFATPVTGVGVAQLPPLGFDDTLPNNQLVDVVGYGVQQFEHRTPLTPSGSRQVATTPVKSAGNLGDQSLKLLAAPGACLGDSGGPNLVSGTNTIVAITSGGNANCKGVSQSLRLDTPVARSFLGQFVSLP